MADEQPKVTTAEENQRLKEIFESKRYVDEPTLLPWYNPELGEVNPEARDLLEKYSKVPPADVEQHIVAVRDEAFKVFPYPCLGGWRFLNLSITRHPQYQEVLDKTKNGAKLLDIGCCLGQDIRKLIHDGAPGENLAGSDLEQPFFDVGYKLFLDKSHLKTQFVQADVFDDNSKLNEHIGEFDIVHAASFFHLFDWDKQVLAVKKVISLLKPQPGSLVVGRQGGMPVGADFSHVIASSSTYWHSTESWAKLWKQVGDETDTKWEVESSLGGEELARRMNTTLVPAGTRFLTFTVRRV